jgi:hypothetical protein
VAETWEWDGADWARVTTATDHHAPACDHMKLAYDSVNGTTVLVGGGHLQDLSPDTWWWDGNAWSLVSSSGPPPRAHHGLVYDAAHQQSLLYGGIDNSSIFDDFWSWNGIAWTELTFAGPGQRSHFGFAVNPEGLLLFGGATGNATFATLTAETWFLTNGVWSQISVPGPSPRGSPALAWDPGREVWVLYGGFDATGAELGDTWEFDGSAWSCAEGCLRGRQAACGSPSSAQSSALIAAGTSWGAVGDDHARSSETISLLDARTARIVSSATSRRRCSFSSRARRLIDSIIALLASDQVS